MNDIFKKKEVLRFTCGDLDLLLVLSPLSTLLVRQLLDKALLSLDLRLEFHSFTGTHVSTF